MTGMPMRVTAVDLPGGRAGPDLRTIAALVPEQVGFQLVAPREVADDPGLGNLPGPVPVRQLIVAACWLTPIALTVVPPAGVDTSVLLVEPEFAVDEEMYDEIWSIYRAVGLPPSPTANRARRSLAAFERNRATVEEELTAATLRRLGAGGTDFARGLVGRYVEWIRALLIARESVHSPTVYDGPRVTVVARTGFELPDWLPPGYRVERVDAPVDDSPLCPPVLDTIGRLCRERFDTAEPAPGRPS